MLVLNEAHFVVDVTVDQLPPFVDFCDDVVIERDARALRRGPRQLDGDRRPGQGAADARAHLRGRRGGAAMLPIPLASTLPATRLPQRGIAPPMTIRFGRRGGALRLRGRRAAAGGAASAKTRCPLFRPHQSRVTNGAEAPAS